MTADNARDADLELEQMFAEMRTGTPEPGVDLMARVLADATDQQPTPAPLVSPARPGMDSVRRPGLWQQLLDQLGGWPAIAALGCVAVLGTWMGISPPADLDTTLAALVGSDDLNSLLYTGSSFDFTQFEG